jgi:hypothetical protein
MADTRYLAVRFDSPELVGGKTVQDTEILPESFRN